ncbi:unnamed protein product [Phytophthora fragariaefolia]|uniref:Unnamed protein product n=1 Tax=Phytophthora fragariaefolia TaxID=1490495 RepID=A0A9W6XLR0_9STRA|nr:unnamed protein product [Phytophthora fragariaefolia]
MDEVDEAMIPHPVGGMPIAVYPPLPPFADHDQQLQETVTRMTVIQSGETTRQVEALAHHAATALQRTPEQLGHVHQESDGGLAGANTSAFEPAPVEEALIPSAEEPSNARKPDDFLTPSDTHDPKGSASGTPPAKAPQERSSTQEDGPDPVDYEESEPDQDRKQGEVAVPNSSPQLTEQQRVTHPGSPLTQKTTAAVARLEAQA